jgi:hypothetical protein
MQSCPVFKKMMQKPFDDLQAQLAKFAQSMPTNWNGYAQPPQQNYGYDANFHHMAPSNACQVPQSQPLNPGANPFKTQQSASTDFLQNLGLGANDQSNVSFVDNGPPPAIPRRESQN